MDARLWAKEKKMDAYCAHTMIAKISPDKETLVCCDCGRMFTNKTSVEEVQDYELETGLVCPSRIDSPWSEN